MSSRLPVLASLVALSLSHVFAEEPAPVAAPRAPGPAASTLSAQPANDADADGKVDPGESVRFSGTVRNTGTNDATSVKIVAPAAPNLTLVPGSLKTTPVAVDDAITVVQNTPQVVPAPGVLTNDFGVPAPGATPQTAATTSLGGTLTLNADGSLIYTPPAGIVSPPADSFTYTVTNPNGTDTATATITIIDRNDAPSFMIAGQGPVALEDAGAQGVGGFATAISPGPANEAAQTVAFNITDNSNPSLFAAGPEVSPTGDLTFTSAPNAFGSAIITLVLQDDGGTAGGGVDTSAPQMFTITINPVNDAPTIDLFTIVTTIEDAALQTINLTSISDGPLESTASITVTATSNNPSVVPDPAVFYTNPSAGGTLTYMPVANQSGTATITVTVMDNGGVANGGADTTAFTFDITVFPLNDTPTLAAIANPAAILEDAGLQTVNLSGISTGAGETQTLTVTAVSGNTALIPNPTVTYASPNATGTLTYTPAPNASGTATITVTVMDDGGTANGGIDTVTQTFTVAVSPVNDAPTLDAIANPAAILEDAGAQTVNLTGIGAGPLETQTLAVTAVSNNTGLIPNPTVTYTSPNATGSLNYTPVANAFGTAVITVTVMDNGGTANGGVNTFQRMFTVAVTAVNDAPTLNPLGTFSLNEDNTGQQFNLFGISAGAGESQTLTITAVSDNTALIPDATVTYTSPDTTGFFVVFPTANLSGTAVITVTVTDSGGTANGGVNTLQRLCTINILPSNEPPTIDPLGEIFILEDSPTQIITFTGIGPGAPEEAGQMFTVTARSLEPTYFPDPIVTYTSPNSTGSFAFTLLPDVFGTGGVLVRVTDSGGTANGGRDFEGTGLTVQVLPVNDAPIFTKGPDQVINVGAGPQTVNGWATGISPGGLFEGGQLVSFTITGNTNPGIFQTLPAVGTNGALTYRPSATVSGVATITLIASDTGGTANGGVNTSAAQTFTITVNQGPTAVADAPAANSVPGNPFHTGLNTTLNTTGGGTSVLTNDTLGGPPATVSNFGPTTGLEVTAASGNTAATTGGGTIRVFANGEFIYTPQTGFTGLDTFRYTITNSAGSSTAQVTIAVGTRPTITNDTYPVTLVGNIGIDTRTSSNFSVLANDVGSGLTVTGGSSTDGTVTFFSDGRFTFDPNAGFTGNASVTYNASTGFGPTTGTLTIPVGTPIWFINNNIGAAGDGRLSRPFNTLAAFIALNDAVGSHPGLNHSIFVYESATAYVGGFPLLPGQRLIGQDASVPLATIAGVTLPADSPTLPAMAPANGTTTTLSNTAQAISYFVPFGPPSNGVIRGLSATSSGSNGIDYFAFVPTGLSIIEVNASGSGNAIFVQALSAGTNLALNTVMVNAGGTAINMQDASLLTITDFADITVNGNAAAGILVGRATFDAVPGGAVQTVSGGNLVIGSAGNPVGVDGLDLWNCAGAVGFADVQIYTSNGVGLQASTVTSFALNVSGTASTVTAIGGEALLLSGITADMTFASATSTNSASRGVSFTHVTGTGVTVNGGSISNSGFIAFMVNNGTAPISYAGSISKNTSPYLVDIQNRPAGAGNITLSGNLNSTGISLGISCQNNAGGTFTFSGGTKILNTPDSNAAVSLVNNTGVAIDFTGGGLQITTTVGTGIFASGGGTLTVSGANNTINCTTSGSPLQIDGVNAGAAGITFASCVSATGQVASISLSTGTKSLGRVSTSSADTPALSLGSAGTVEIGGTTASTLTTTSATAIQINTTTLNLVGTGAGAGVDISTQNGIGINSAGVATITGGELDITANAGIGLSALSGTLTITGAGNDITTDTGTGIFLINANAGAGGISFDSCTTASGSVASITLSTGTKSLGRISATTSATALYLSSAGTVNVGGTAASALATATATALFIEESTLNLVGTGAGAGLDINTTSGTGVNCSGTVAITGGELDVTTTSGTGFTAAALSNVTLTGAGNDITTGSGVCVNLSNVSAGASGITFASCTSATGRVAIISSSTGTKSLGQVSTSSGATVPLTLTNAGTVNIGGTGASSVTTTTANALAINDTTLNIAGAGLNLTTTNGGNGVNIASGTTAFTGAGLTLSTTGTGIGFNATNCTVTVAGTGHTISSASARALSLSNVVIGAAGMTFQSISAGNATAAADPDNGIFLDTPGSTGGLTVTGTGTANSGGTIQSTTSHGIRLNNCRSISLTRMRIQNITGVASSGIFGKSVNGFTLNNSNLSNIGNLTPAPDDGHGIEFGSNGLTDNNVSGSIAISNNTFTGMINRGINIATVNNTANTLLISNNSVAGTAGAGIGIGVNYSGNATVSSANILLNTVVANSVGGAGGIVVGLGNGTVADTPTMNLLMDGNVISQTDGNGILCTVRGCTGTMNAKIQNSNVAAPLGGSRPGIRVDSGNPTGNATVRLNISNNLTGGSGGSPGIGVRKEGTVANVNTFAIQGLTPSPANVLQTEDFVSGNNTNSVLGNAVSGTKRCIVLNGDNFVTTTLVP